MCDRAVEAGWRTESSVVCSDCKFLIPLMPANEEFVSLIDLISATLFDDMGGVNFSAVDAGIKAYQIPSERYRETIIKLNEYVQVVKEHRKVQENGRPNTYRAHRRR